MIGDNFHIIANGSLLNITIDVTRPYLVSIGNNVMINKNFTLLTHDFVSGVFLGKYHDFLPSSGKVTIGNNVQFGVNCTVLKGVTIGDNCFIGAGSIVTHDIPANSVATGIPCSVVCSLDEYYEKRKRRALAEAVELVIAIRERYGRDPFPSELREEFVYFVNRDNVKIYEAKGVPVQFQLGKAYDDWLQNHSSIFPNFKSFLEYVDSCSKDGVRILS